MNTCPGCDLCATADRTVGSTLSMKTFRIHSIIISSVPVFSSLCELIKKKQCVTWSSNLTSNLIKMVIIFFGAIIVRLLVYARQKAHSSGLSMLNEVLPISFSLFILSRKLTNEARHWCFTVLDRIIIINQILCIYHCHSVFLFLTEQTSTDLGPHHQIPQCLHCPPLPQCQWKWMWSTYQVQPCYSSMVCR